MNGTFHIEFKTTHGHLHVRPRGDFDGTSAWILLNFLQDRYRGEKKVFIDTDHLTEIHPFGCRTFKCRLNLTRLPTDRIVFKGKNGFELAPKGCRVLSARDNMGPTCEGDCQNCVHVTDPGRMNA